MLSDHPKGGLCTAEQRKLAADHLGIGLDAL
jgi:hypothetical protein